MAARRLRSVALVVGAWTLVALLFTIQIALQARASGTVPQWGRLLAWTLAGWWSWAAFTPLVWAFAAWSLRVRRTAARVALHAGAAFVTAPACAALEGMVKWSLHLYREPHSFGAGVGESVIQYTAFNVLVYAMVAGFYFARRAARLEAQLARARLETLTAQLQPHFLFNTLHTISALVLEDPRAANRMIARLSELLRHSFDQERGMVTLAEELELLDHYVAIQETRFGERLRVSVRVDPAVATAIVPTLLLQPLVENAIRHGAAARGGTGGTGGEAGGVSHVEIAVRPAAGGKRLRLEVRDDGPGFPPGAPIPGGVGLANTRARLEQLYGPAHRLELANASPPEGGARVTIEIPLTDDARADR